MNKIARLFLVLALSVLPAAAVSLPAFGKAVDVQVQRVWQHAHAPSGIGQKSEIVAHDDRTDTLWVVGVVGVDVLDRATLVDHIDVTSVGAVNSVAIHDGLAALAIENTESRPVTSSPTQWTCGTSGIGLPCSSTGSSRERSPATCRRAAHQVRVVINLKTAKALSLTNPPSLLARADQVIE